VQGTNAWVRATLASATGTGVVNGAVYGWRIPNAASQGGGGGGITCLTGDVSAGSGSGCTTATVEGLKSVPFCTGYTPTNGQFVQYTTASSPNPCYTAATGAASGLVLLGQYTASSSSELDAVTRNATGQSGAIIQVDFDDYWIELVNMVNGSPCLIGFQMSTDGGVTYDTGTNYDYNGQYSYNGGSGFYGAAGVSSMQLRDVNQTLATNGSLAGGFKLFGPGSSSLFKQINGQMVIYDSGLGILNLQWGSIWKNASSVNAFRLILSTGVLTSGTMRVYGASKN
jgi:hypothetical protein